MGLILVAVFLALQQAEAVEPSLPHVFDAVVVGGGLAGLTAGHFLKDKDVLVLEKDSAAGGMARGETWGALRYTVAATYLSEPYGVIRRLLDELGLKATKIAHPQDSLRLPGKIIPDFLDAGIKDLPHAPSELEGIRKMARDLRRYAQGEIVAMPPVPSPREMTPEMLQLDRLTFSEFLGRSYGRAAVGYGDLICRGIFGAGAAEISALQGVNALAAQYAATAAFEGGLGAIPEALERELGARLRTRATVLSVRQDKQGVLISFAQDGGTRTVRARTVILAVAAPAILKMVPDLPPVRREALEAVRYSAYALLVLALAQPVPMQSMSYWSVGTVFTDLSLTGIPSPEPSGREGPRQLLLAAVPFGAGAQKDLDRVSDAALAQRVLQDAEKLFPGISKKQSGTRVIRWRYAMPVIGPGYLTSLRPRLAEPWERIFFAGQETEMPYSEGAIVSGFRAAAEVRSRLHFDGSGEN